MSDAQWKKDEILKKGIYNSPKYVIIIKVISIQK